MCVCGEGNGTPLQHSCLENPMDRGAWWAAVLGVAESRKRLSDFTFTFHFPALEKEMANHSNILAWRIPGMGEPGGLPSMGSHRVRHDWSDLAAAAAHVCVSGGDTRISELVIFKHKHSLEYIYILCIYICMYIYFCIWGFPGGSDGKEAACKAEDWGSIPWLGRSPGNGNGNPLQHSCLENSMDRGAWWAAIYGVTKSQAWLSDTFTLISISFYTHWKPWFHLATSNSNPTLEGLL